MRFKLEKDKHFFISDLRNDTFCISDGQYYMVSHNGEIFASDKRKSHFHVKGKNLKHNHHFVSIKKESNPYSIDEEYTFYLESELTQNSLNIELDPFDIEYSTRGSYAFIYQPSLFSDKCNITRIVLDSSGYVSAPVRSELEFRTFCLFPLNITHSNNIVIEEYKTCIGSKDFHQYMRDTPFVTFLTSFRNLWTGLKVFTEQRFFHGDISSNNIVIDNGIFKFIDYDLSFYLDDLSKASMFNNGVLYTIYPLTANIIAIRHFQDVTGKYADIRRDKSVTINTTGNFFQERLRFGKIGDLITSNLEDDQKSRKIIKMFEIPDLNITENAFYYISIYQLAVAMAIMIVDYKLFQDISAYDKEIISFLRYCLDFKHYGFITIDDAIERYNEMINKITEIDLDKEYIFELDEVE